MSNLLYSTMYSVQKQKVSGTLQTEREWPKSKVIIYDFCKRGKSKNKALGKCSSEVHGICVPSLEKTHPSSTICNYIVKYLKKIVDIIIFCSFCQKFIHKK